MRENSFQAEPVSMTARDSHDHTNEILRYLDTYGVIDKDAARADRNRHNKRTRRGKGRSRRTLDLHGKTGEEALRLLRHALERCKRNGVGELLVIHGRGIHSQAGGAVLKQAVRTALEREMAGMIQSYRPALPREGGAGATVVYVH